MWKNGLGCAPFLLSIRRCAALDQSVAYWADWREGQHRWLAARVVVVVLVVLVPGG